MAKSHFRTLTHLPPDFKEMLEAGAKAACADNGDDWDREGPRGLPGYRNHFKASLAGSGIAHRLNDAYAALNRVKAIIERGYPTVQCDHGIKEGEDCIACYDNALNEALGEFA